MAGRTTHQFDEVPVFASRVGVALDVTNHFSVGLASSVEAEGGFNLLVFQVAVNGFGAADDLHAIVVSGIVFSQHTSVGVGVVTTDDDDGFDAEFTNDFETAFKLVFFFEFGTSGADEVKTAGVAIFVNQFVGEFNVLVVHQTAGAHQESVEFVSGVLFFEFIVETTDHVVSAGGLTSGENDTDVHRSIFFLFVGGDKIHERHAVGVGEEFFDFFLVTHALGGSTFFDAHIATQTCGKFGLISSTGNL